VRKGRILRGLAAVTALVLVVGVVLYQVADRPSDASETPRGDLEPDAAIVARGAYLAAASDCVSCHTLPGEPAYSGGREFRLPFGSVYGSNITPDVTYGIGSWSDSDFIAAMHRGMAKGGRHLYPVFPYRNYTQMPVSDVLAIKAYLFSLKPVPAPSIEDRVRFPFNQTWGIAYWNLLFNSNSRFRPEPSLSDQLNRGAYLVEGPGHCELCHSPLNVAFVPEKAREAAGAVVDGVHCYNISSDERWGVGSWSNAELVKYMKTGHTEGRGAAGASMGEVVENSTSQMSDEDLRAVAAYLKKLAPQPGDVEISTRSQAAAPDGLEAFAGEPDGRRIYEGACIGCHGSGGAATAAAANLQGHPSVNDRSGRNATWVTLHGVDYRTAEGHVYMPAFADAYSDAEVASVVRYVLAAFGSGAATLSLADVAEARK
jgi:mono/diheme cytochrome c family protein